MEEVGGGEGGGGGDDGLAVAFGSRFSERLGLWLGILHSEFGIGGEGSLLYMLNTRHSYSHTHHITSHLYLRHTVSSTKPPVKQTIMEHQPTLAIQSSVLHTSSSFCWTNSSISAW